MCLTILGHYALKGQQLTKTQENVFKPSVSKVCILKKTSEQVLVNEELMKTKLMLVNVKIIIRLIMLIENS